MSQLEGETIHNQRSQTLEVYDLQKYSWLYFQQYNNSQTIYYRHYIHLLILHFFGSGKRTTWFKLIRSKMVPIDIITIEFISD
jgi:hypothetical protein